MYRGAQREAEMLGAFVYIRPVLGLVPVRSPSIIFDALDEFKNLKISKMIKLQEIQK